MSGPIVRTGATPEFWENWDQVFGKKTKKSASGKKADKKTDKPAKAAKKKAPKKKVAAKKSKKK